METSDSFALQETLQNEPLSSDVKFNALYVQEQKQNNKNCVKCVISWASFSFMLMSIICIYFVISSMEDYYNVYQCLILSQCILACIVSMIGVIFSIQACYRAKSVLAVCFRRNNKM
ncbi:Hypothetical_protein [Hexamita inflata]|uniref:Hypothetical_protein n=1 Tax=Hexamita inflata TaxID=28002 RepID=A0AA86P1C4_9EUKA|nr:Hypothetical protein HINF_LOCUS17734 [Hexamita inflata]